MHLLQFKYFRFNLMTLVVGFFLITHTHSLSGQSTGSTGKDKNHLLEKNVDGPLLVKTTLIESGVLEAPKYNFTNEFDAEKSEENIKGIFYEGLSFKGKPTKVFSWYGVPENLTKNDKVPAIVLVHGGGGTAFIDWVKEWTNRGYVAIAIALEGQIPGDKIEGENGKKEYQTFEYSGPKRQGFFEDVVVEKLEDQWFFHAVADVMLATSLLKSLPNVDENKIGITGISWGGILTNVITGVDNRYAFAIPVYGCGYLQETPNYSNLLSQLSKEQQTYYLDTWEPSLYVPLQKQPTLFVNGTNDFHFTMNSFTKTYEASPNEKYLSVGHNMKHGHQAGWAPESIYSFAEYMTNNGTAPELPKLIQNKNKKLLYQYQGKVDKAYLYYSTDTSDWGKDSYQWIETTTEVSDTNKTISAKLPEEAVAYFINVINSEGRMYSSPMKIVDGNRP
ncbi:alpha/beta hydrolase family protein [Zobellia barbeyronii]|uniref:Acetylxylan esterase n=1 Tax=Zobellia barbeyronii TaxID=2748009 RepID=A0ABS5WDP7_9FLAO|nr:acetylxylan esterase [Zobellia barbeyronii]MBT2161521.1 acetylxylan esterase [Zobellia barbeyronii]